MKIHHHTKEELQRGIALATGERHRIVVPRPKVVLEVEWDEEVVAELADDLALSLTVRGEVQRQRLQDGYRRNGRIGTEFRLLNVSDPTSMHASAGGDKVALWKGRAIDSEPGLSTLARLIEPPEEPGAQQDQGVTLIATLEPGPHGEGSGGRLIERLPFDPSDKDLLA